MYPLSGSSALKCEDANWHGTFCRNIFLPIQIAINKAATETKECKGSYDDIPSNNSYLIGS